MVDMESALGKAGRSLTVEHKRMIGYAFGLLALAIGLNFGVSRIYQVMLDRAVASWTEAMKDRLQNPANETYFGKLNVVGAGRTLEDKLEMERVSGPVNVRNVAGFSFEVLPGFALPTSVIGKVSTGSEIYNAILVNGWGVARCSDIKGLVLEPGQNPVLCAIYYDYLRRSQPIGNQPKPNQNGVVK